jgi:hypothetical protein
MIKNKVKSMNEIPVAEALAAFNDILTDPERLWSQDPEWFKEVGTRDFLECLKMYADQMGYGESSVAFEEQRHQLVEAVQQLPEQTRGSIYARLSPREKQTYDILLDNPGLSQKELADKFSPPISVKTLKIYLASLRDNYGVQTTRELHITSKT